MRRRNERGAGTVLTAGVCSALLTATWLAATVVAWLAQVGAVQDSADLTSLAAASAHARGADACVSAEEVARRNGSDLVECRVVGDHWSFVVEIRVGQPLKPSLPGMPQSVERDASAGSVP